jgi:hypothetical protein
MYTNTHRHTDTHRDTKHNGAQNEVYFVVCWCVCLKSFRVTQTMQSMSRERVCVCVRERERERVCVCVASRCSIHYTTLWRF